MKAVSPYVQTGAWFPHPEALFFNLLSSKNEMDRRFAVGKVLEVRGDRELGDAELRLRLTPKHKIYHNLIALEKEVMHKSICTCNLSKGYYPTALAGSLLPASHTVHKKGCKITN